MSPPSIPTVEVNQDGGKSVTGMLAMPLRHTSFHPTPFVAKKPIVTRYPVPITRAP